MKKIEIQGMFVFCKHLLIYRGTTTDSVKFQKILKNMIILYLHKIINFGLENENELCDKMEKFDKLETFKLKYAMKRFWS